MIAIRIEPAAGAGNIAATVSSCELRDRTGPLGVRIVGDDDLERLHALAPPAAQGPLEARGAVACYERDAYSDFGAHVRRWVDVYRRFT